MRYYGINEEFLNWISAWLTQSNQRVCVDGEMSGTKPVRSGVPQGTMLRPLCFLLYINDIGDLISPCSSIRLFVDDYLHYRTVNSTESCQQLQNDLIRLVEWSKQWQMTFHPTKCFILRVTKKTKPSHLQLQNDGSSTRNCPSLSLPCSRIIRRYELGSSYIQSNIKGQQDTRIPTEKLKQVPT
jgi:hypothetical protein